MVKTGNVGVAGTTGTVLRRSLMGARDLVDRALAETRLTQGIQNREPLLVATLIDDVAQAANLSANSLGHMFMALPIAPDLAISVDRQVLTAVLMNVLQNAFKFTRPASTVTLRVVATADRVRIEIQDECGGLGTGDAEGLFHPFEQRHANRTGLGIGLAFSRWATEANDGQISARNLPGIGCVFTVDLPRCPSPALAPALGPKDTCHTPTRV
jgi:signal transduction histidine kinase